MTTVAIMQPTYLPWIGYFDLIDQADVFVLLDNVAVSRQSWQMRNRIRARDGSVVWLRVPTHARLGQPLNEVRIALEHEWKEKHWRILQNAYGHAPNWPIDELITPFETWHARLIDLTEHLIQRAMMALGITTPLVPASTFAHQRDDRIGRLADILHATEATEFLQTAGGHENLNGLIDIDGIPIRYHNYQHPVYSQGGQPFMSHLAIVDLLAWHGPDALDVIRSGRKTSELVG